MSAVVVAVSADIRDSHRRAGLCWIMLRCVACADFSEAELRELLEEMIADDLLENQGGVYALNSGS